MDSLLSRLTSLSYELFGVLLPGAFASAFLAVLSVALGPLWTRWTFGYADPLTLTRIIHFAERIPGGLVFVSVSSLVLTWYVVGHALNFISRSGSRSARSESVRRVWSCLRFRVPKPSEEFHSDLRPMFEVLSKRFSVGDSSLNWRQFYPLAKCFLSESGRHSLVSTYQNKYTLHRSITAAGSALFWLSAVSIVGAMIASRKGAVGEPIWPMLLAVPFIALAVVGGFSKTYQYSWSLFGDTLITETYCLLYGPRISEKDK